jgi:signal transduction histidine kinase
MNVAKHSGSASADVILSREADQLEMHIRDSGRGIESEEEGRMGIGLTGIEERVRLLNGKLIVNSKPGFGTEIVVTVPAQRNSLSL